MPIQNVSFQTPDQYGAQQVGIDRQRRLAEALMVQGQQPIDPSQSSGGWAIPVSPMQGLAKLAQTYTGVLGTKKADEREQALADKYKTDLSAALVNAQQAAGPHQEPVDTSQEGTGSFDMSGSQGPSTQTVPGSREKMIQALMSHPATQPLAMQAMSAQLQEGMTAEQLAGIMGGGAGTATTPSGGNPMVPGPGASVMAGSGSTTPQGQPQGAPQTQGPGGIFNATATQLSAMLLSPNPQIAKAAEAVLAQRKVTALRPNAPGVDQWGNVVTQPTPLPPTGGGIRIGPNGPEAYAIPNAEKIGPAYAGAMAGAEGAAKVPYQTGTTASGAQMPNYMIPGFITPPGSPQASPNPQAQPAPVAAPRPAPAAAQPAPAGVDPWATVPKLPVPQGMGQGTYDKTIAEHQATSANELSKKYGELADHANQRKVLNDQALSLVDKADTGPAAAGIADVKNWLTSRFGIAEDKFQNTPSATIALQKDLLNAATQKAKAQFGARMTQSEVLLMLSKGAPNVDMTKAAIKYLIASDNASADYQIKQANDLGTYLQKGGDPLRFDAWYSKAFPMTKAIGGVHLQTNGVKDIVNSGGEQKVVNWSDLGRKTP